MCLGVVVVTQCAATSKRSGAQCKRHAAVAQRVCSMHGAKSPQAKRKAAERQERERIEALADTLGTPVEGSDPAEVITERIDARRGHVRWLLARVRELEPDALTWGKTRSKTGGDDHGVTEEAKPHVWYALYEESAAKLERLCIEAVRVGVEERRVRLDERIADMWVRVIDGLLVELGHDPNDPQTAGIVARHLELVA